MPDLTQEVIELRAAIREHTGRAPQSKDPEFLKQRLADLRAARDASSTVDKSVVVPVSMHGRARDAAKRIADREGGGLSALVRRALAEFADRHGYKAEASAFDTEEA